MDEEKTFLERLQERTRKGAANMAESKRTASDTATKPSLALARQFVDETMMPAVERAADGGNWHVECHLKRPDADLNESIVLAEIQRIMRDERAGVRVDIVVWPGRDSEYVNVHVSWLPPVTMAPLLSQLKRGVVGISTGDLRATGVAHMTGKTPSGKDREETTLTGLYVRKDACLLPVPGEREYGYRVELSREEKGKPSTVKVFGRLEILVVESPDPREWELVEYSCEGPDATILASDLRKAKELVDGLLSARVRGEKE